MGDSKISLIFVIHFPFVYLIYSTVIVISE